MNIHLLLLILLVVTVNSLSVFDKSELTKEYRDKFELFLKNGGYKKKSTNSDSSSLLTIPSLGNNNNNNGYGTINFTSLDSKQEELARNSVDAILVFDADKISEIYCNSPTTRYVNYHWRVNWEDGSLVRGTDGKPLSVGQDVLTYAQIVATVAFFKTLVSHGGRQCVCGKQHVYPSDSAVGTANFPTFPNKYEYPRKASWRGFMCGTFIPGVGGPDPITACEEAYYDYHFNAEGTCIQLASAFDHEFHFPTNISTRLYNIADYDKYCKGICKVLKDKYQEIDLTPHADLMSRVNVDPY